MPNISLDITDRKILIALQENGRISNLELADKAGLSPSPCSRRVKQLEESGVISRYVTLLDPQAIGLPIHAFVNVRLEKQAEKSLRVFEDTVRKFPEVMECYLMTGDADYLLRVVVPDLAGFERFLLDRLTRIAGVASIKSSFALKQVQYRTALPLGHLEG